MDRLRAILRRRFAGGTSAVVVLFCTCLYAISAGPATAPSPIDPQRIAIAIAQLGDADAAVRERASLLLWSMGKAAEPALDEAARSGEAEVASRARQVLGDIRLGIGPNDPPQIIATVHEYRRAEPMEKRELISQLMGLKAYTVLARLCTLESSEMLRGEISRQLSQKVAEAVPALVCRGEFATAEQWLDVGLLDGSDISGRAYAMYYLLRGQADARIAQLANQGNAPHAARAAALLYRAKGDAAKARQAAEKSHDQDLLDDLLLEQGEWKTLANRIQQSVGDEADLEKAGFLTMYYRLAGDEDNARRALDLVHRYDGARDQAPAVAHVLLLNDHPQEGIDLLIKHGQAANAFSWLWAQHRYAQALEIARPLRADGDSLLLDKALLLHQLGRKQECQDLFADLAKRSGDEPVALLSLAQGELQCELADPAFEHAGRALSANAQSEVLLLAFRALLPDQEGAVTWWNYFRSIYPQENSRQTLTRVRRLLRHEMPAGELPALVDRALTHASGMAVRDRGRFLGLLANAIFACGQEQLGQSILKQAMADKCCHVMLGELAAIRGDWASAARLYSGEEIADADTAVPAALRGFCLVQSGQKEQGQKLIDRASLVILGDGTKRCELAQALEKIGLWDAATEQYQLVLRSAPFFSAESANAAYQVAMAAARKGDFDLAAATSQRLALHALRADTHFTRSREYVLLPPQIHRYRAASLLKSGKMDEAMKEIELAQSLLPSDILLAIDIVPLLEKAGRKKEADALFDRVLTIQRQICKDYPDSPQARNEIAWLLARCRRNLDEALAQANKAVELAPKNAAIVDTLAEVCFQRGQRPQAIEVMKRCIALEPGTFRHKLALNRIEQSSPDSAPIE